MKVETVTGCASTLVLIAIGANLPGPFGQSAIDTCRHAVARLDSINGLRLRGLSRWYSTSPVPPSGQPDYVNAVAALLVHQKFPIEPVSLLAELMAIETACGRQRKEANAARTLDLDIIAIGTMVRSSPDPILPHPRAHQRVFVLTPLIDVAPDWIHPILHQTPVALLATLPATTLTQQTIRPL